MLCNSCCLIFVPAEYHLTPDEEKQRYSLHQNSGDNKQYVTYLSKIADEVLDLADLPLTICDFGSGKEHVLTDILSSRGATCQAHDPLYGMVAQRHGEFDIIVACESFEHFRNPRHDLDLMGRLLKPAGFVYVRTRLHDEVEDISAWWYAKDPTHISFFCGKTMETVAEVLGKRIVMTNGRDTVVIGP